MFGNNPKTQKGRDTKEIILRTALELFLSNGYEKATIAQLIEKSGMSRGAIFYYYKDKFSIYKDVIDLYILKYQNVTVDIEIDPSTTFLQLIHNYLDRLKETNTDLEELESYTPAKYFKLVFEAGIYYPEFSLKVSNLIENENRLWARVIGQDIERGTIRGDIDIERTIRHFRHSYYGMSVEASFGGYIDLNLLQTLFMDIYNRLTV